MTKALENLRTKEAQLISDIAQDSKRYRFLQTEEARSDIEERFLIMTKEEMSEILTTLNNNRRKLKEVQFKIFNKQK